MKSLPRAFSVALAVFMLLLPLASEQGSQAQSTIPYAATPPPANNWLLKSWSCSPADCFDYVVVQQSGNAYTSATGIVNGTALNGAHNPFAEQSIKAINCTNTVFLETGVATFRLTTKQWFAKTYGMEGLIVPAEVTEDGMVTGYGYDLEWSDGTFTNIPFLVAC